MNILGFNISRAPKAVGKSMSVAAFLRGDDAGEAGGAVLTSAYQQSVWVYSCINTVARQLAQIEWKLCEETAKAEREIEAGPVFDLFRQPHPFLNRFDFWELVAAWLLLRGKCFVAVLDKSGSVLPVDALAAGRGKPAQMVILSADRMRLVVEGQTLAGFNFSAGHNDPMASQSFLPGELIYLRLPHPFDFWEGMAPLSVARLAAEADYASAQFNKGLMQNNADTGVIVTTEQQLDDPQIEQIKAALKERKRKAGTPDRPLFLTNGAKIEKPTLAAADMQFLENRKFNRQEICAVFGVPQEILGFTEDANRSVGESARLNFIENTIMPLGDRVAAGFAPVCRAAGRNVIGYFDYDDLPIMRAAQRTRIDSAVKLWAMGVPFADANDALDLGLPERPWHTTGYLPFSVAPAGSELPGADEPADQPAEADPMQEAFGKLAKAVTGMKQRDRAGECHVCAPHPDWERAVAGSIAAKKGKLGKFFFEQRVLVLAAMGEASAELGKAFGSPDTYQDINAIAAAKMDFNSEVFAKLEKLIAAENERLLKMMNPLLRVDLNYGGQQLYAEIGASDIFQIPPAKAIEFLNQRENAIKGVNATTFDKLKASLQEGLANGDTYQQLVERVKTEYQEAGQLRAETIATTETQIAVNSGRHEGMKQAGVERKGWQTSRLANTRFSHKQNEDFSEANNGIAIDAMWPNGVRFPGDPEGDPGEVINCRCFGFAILPDEKGARKGRISLLGYSDYLNRTGAPPAPESGLSRKQ